MENSLTIEQLASSPADQFTSWFEEAKAIESISYPEASCLSTIDLNGYPDSRMVLVKEASVRGFVFFTNSKSNKGQSLEKTPKASLNFYWMPLDRQVRAKGDVQELPEEESDRYFASRPKGSQIGAWASEQSQELSSREELASRVSQLEERFQGKDVPRPAHWKGYLLKPFSIHFWLQRESRLHDSFVYLLDDSGSWKIKRLNP